MAENKYHAKFGDVKDRERILRKGLETQKKEQKTGDVPGDVKQRLETSRLFHRLAACLDSPALQSSAVLGGLFNRTASLVELMLEMSVEPSFANLT